VIELFLASFISFLVIVDPLGTAAVFSALTAKMTPYYRKKIAIQAVFIATLLLIFFGLAGKFLLLKMGISLDAFRIAGGLLIFVTAFRMIMGFHDSDKIDSNDSVYKDTSNIAVFPLAIPLLAGPGCMTAMILNMGNAVGFEHKAIVIFCIIIVELLALAAMLFAGKITAIMGPTGSSLLSRLMGILLAALAVQFVADGILNILKSA
jgi:multiple antibiotic resistance protein